LADAAPDGIDVFVDMVGGEQLVAAVGAAREGARFVLLGVLTAELDRQGASIVAPAALDSFQLILKDVTVRGYSADRDIAAFAEWIAWQRDAGLHFARTMVAGLDDAPRALHDACEGRMRGVVIVAL
jgi:NADPH-dependent curcumin reductase CurA